MHSIDYTLLHHEMAVSYKGTPPCIHFTVQLPTITITDHSGQIHGEFKAFVKEQIKQKLVAFDGDAKASKTRSAMKWWWWSKCISMAIAKTASRNVAFKVAKMREAIMEGQDELLMCNSGQTEGGLEANNAAFLEDVAQNADLYIANQGGSMQI